MIMRKLVLLALIMGCLNVYGQMESNRFDNNFLNGNIDDICRKSDRIYLLIKKIENRESHNHILLTILDLELDVLEDSVIRSIDSLNRQIEYIKISTDKKMKPTDILKYIESCEKSIYEAEEALCIISQLREKYLANSN